MTSRRSRICGPAQRRVADASSRRTPTTAASASASSPSCRYEVERIRAFPPGTDPVRLQDDGTTTNQMGRGALRAVRVAGTGRPDHRPPEVQAADLPAAASARATRTSAPATPATRSPCARRGDHAARPRHRAARRPGPAGRRARRPQRRAARRDDADPARPARHGVQDRRLRRRPTRATPSASGTSRPMLPEGRAFSRIFNGRPELIDHILVSHELAQRSSPPTPARPTCRRSPPTRGRARATAPTTRPSSRASLSRRRSGSACRRRSGAA